MGGSRAALISKIQTVCRDLFLSGLIDSHSGNVSVRRGKNILIKKTGAQLRHFSKSDFVEFPLKSLSHPGVSSDYLTHRKIYLEVPQAQAILHAHPPTAVALSLYLNEIKTVDLEGHYYLPRIPVVSVNYKTYAEETRRKLPEVLRKYPVAVVRGHGTFAHGKDLDEALKWTTLVEQVSKILFYSSLYKKLIT